MNYKINILEKTVESKNKRIADLEERISSSFLTNSDEENDNPENLEKNTNTNKNFPLIPKSPKIEKIDDNIKNSQINMFKSGWTEERKNMIRKITENSGFNKMESPLTVNDNKIGFLQRRQPNSRKSVKSLRLRQLEEESQKNSTKFIKFQEMMDETLKENTELKSEKIKLIKNLKDMEFKSKKIKEYEKKIEILNHDIENKEKQCSRLISKNNALRQKLKTIEENIIELQQVHSSVTNLSNFL